MKQVMQRDKDFAIVKQQYNFVRICHSEAGNTTSEDFAIVKQLTQRDEDFAIVKQVIQLCEDFAI